MQRLICFLLTGLFATNVCLAQFSAIGGANGVPYVYEPAVSSGLDRVFVFNGQDNSRISYKTGNPADWTWYRYDTDPATAVAVAGETTSTETFISNVQANSGYMVVSTNGARHFAYVVGYTPVDYREIGFVTDGDVCNTLTLAVSSDAQDLNYYSVKGIKLKLVREHKLSWNSLEWNAENKEYVTKVMTSKSQNNLAGWSVDAPLTDTKFTVTGDQFAESFGNVQKFESALYEAVAVKTNALAELQERDAKNEVDRVSESGDLTGSAPLNIDFFSHPSDAVDFEEWYIYDTPEASDNYKRRMEKDISYSFQQSGTSLVKLYVSNATCRDSASFSPQVLVSFIDCPNFFTPRSTPGENDEFRVAYKSIISFKGTILNRWGNVLFEWSDPALGWNGTYKGKAVSPGVYFYVIEAKGSDGKIWKKKGDINLLE